MSELVAVRDLEKEYRGGPEVVRVLKGVSLSVARGEVVVLVGASGVGKSTLLHLLGALDRPTAGQVLFDGEDVSARSESGLPRFRRTEGGFIFQFYNLLGEMTALENAMLPALLQRLPWEEARSRAADPPHEVGLGDRLTHRPGELSGGEQQRVAIARAVMHRPRLRPGRRAPRQPGPPTPPGGCCPFSRGPQAGRGLTCVPPPHTRALARKADRGYRLGDGRAVPWP